MLFPKHTNGQRKKKKKKSVLNLSLVTSTTLNVTYHVTLKSHAELPKNIIPTTFQLFRRRVLLGGGGGGKISGFYYNNKEISI